MHCPSLPSVVRSVLIKARTTVTGALVERDAPRRFTLAGRYTESH